MSRGVPYVDVRSQSEFAQGHVPGALNVPWRQDGPGGMVDNPDFVRVMKALFEPSRELVIGCRSGARSASACSALASEGFTSLLDLAPGFAGSRDPFGRPLPGWADSGLAVEFEVPAEQSYAGLLARVG